MTTTIEFRFPWGLYHATPWSRSANEGVVEWPPAPWRILRALYAAWMTHSPHLGADVVEPLLARLGDPPSFVLPEHTEAHTRHYMPGVQHLNGVKTDTDKTLDTFAVMRRGACVWVTWPVDLTAGEIEVLDELLHGVRYLGRAESIVEARVVVSPDDGHVVAPNPDGSGEPVLAPDFTSSPVSTLTVTTSAVRKARRLLPAGTRVVFYDRPAVVSTVRRSRRSSSPPTVTAVRLAVAGPVAPSRYLAVAFGSLLHAAAVKRFDELTNGASSPALSGRGEDRQPLKGEHRHGHYLALPGRDDLSDRGLGSLLVWTPAGLTPEEVEALGAIRALYPDRFEGMGKRRLLMTAAGDVADVAPELVGPSRVWESVTPYAPVHHHKGSPEEQLLSDVNLELAHRRRSPAVSVGQVTNAAWRKYRRHRPGKERLAQQRRVTGVRIEFAEPVDGPLVLGQLSHFGLGLFRPVE